MAVMENKAVSTETEKAEQQPQTGGQSQKEGSFRLSQKLTITFLILLLVCTFVFAALVVTCLYTKRRLRDDLEHRLAKGAEQLDEMLIGGSLREMDYYYCNDDISTLASAFAGRIIVLDDNYRVAVDTYHKLDGRILLDSDIYKVMTGKLDKYVEYSDQYVHYVSPVTSGDNNISGVAVIVAATDSIDTLLRYQRKLSYVILVLIGLFTVILAFLIARLSVCDIMKLRKHVENMKDGFLSHIDIKGGFRETCILTNDINKVFAQAQVLEESRQEFVSNVSHELKTPITSMKVLSESLLMQENVPADMYREFMKDIVSEIDRESQIITDLLTLVKTEKDSGNLNFERTDINELMDVILKRLNPLARKRNIDISYESFRDVEADIDKVKFTLAISNLIENGIKYNIEGGSIRVSLNADYNNLYIKVADTGVGIPDDCVDHIFERFYRVDKARSRDTGGTGLGLSISKNIITLHRGTINVYSEPGKGTTFTVRVPMNREKDGE